MKAVIGIRTGVTAQKKTHIASRYFRDASAFISPKRSSVGGRGVGVGVGGGGRGGGKEGGMGEGGREGEGIR